MPTIPNQERSLDPYSENRYSSTINRFNRIVSGATDCILYDEQSFLITRNNDTSLSIGAGLCVKDDVLIHVKEDNYQIDMTDWDYYIDPSTGGSAMDSTGYYYVVLNYVYTRSLPAPKACYRIIKDIDTYFTPYVNLYVFLGAVHVVSGGAGYILNSDPTCVYYYDPADPLIVRQTPPSDVFHIDGGIIT